MINGTMRMIQSVYETECYNRFEKWGHLQHIPAYGSPTWIKQKEEQERLEQEFGSIRGQLTELQDRLSSFQREAQILDGIEEASPCGISAPCRSPGQ